MPTQNFQLTQSLCMWTFVLEPVWFGVQNKFIKEDFEEIKNFEWPFFST